MYLKAEKIKNTPLHISFETAELLYVYIKEYKVFKNVGFCLHPAFNIIASMKKNKLNVIINKKKNFVDLFQTENLNLKIICGRNGAGKSSLLEILKKDNSNCCIYIFMDKDGVFASSDNATIEYENKLHHISETTVQSINPSFACPIHENMNVPDFKLNKGIVPFYFEKKNVFKDILPPKEPLISHFNVKIYNSTFNEIVPYTSSFLSDKDRERLEDIKDKDWLAFFLITCLCDNTCEEIIKQIKSKNKNIIDYIQSILEKNRQKKIIHDIYEQQKELMSEDFEINQYDVVIKRIHNLSDKMNELAKRIYGEIFIVYSMYNLVHCLGFAQKNGKKRYLNDLSTGEFLKVKYNYELFHSLAQKDRMWLTNDEPENGLHPEWCRQFLKNYMSSFRNVINFCSKRCEDYQKEKRMSIFIATHSPFILSDVTNDYVIYLEKDKDGFAKEVKAKKNTFCGNIGEMLSMNFFMDATIGAFASDKIVELVENMKRGIFNKNLINCIGDSLLQKLLIEKTNRNAKN